LTRRRKGVYNKDRRKTMLLRALRVTARRGVRRLSTPTAASPEAVCANIGVDHHEGALDQVFASLDQNGDGKIDPKELKEGLGKAGLELTDKALNRLTETYGDDTGSLKQAGLLEMLAAVRDHKFHSFAEEAPVEEEALEPPQQTPIHYVFSDVGHFEGAVDAALVNADADGDGALNPEELRGALAERGVDVSPQKLSHLYSLYCRGDGKLELVEFANLCGTLTTEHCEEDSFS
jgi:Ca2+-binding EF-hand superfamily protein